VRVSHAVLVFFRSNGVDRVRTILAAIVRTLVFGIMPLRAVTDQ
jgi:hypothetical protein